MSPQPLERRTKEAIGLALLSIAAVAVLRFPIESKVLFTAEMLTLATLLVVDLVKDPVGNRTLKGSLTRSTTIAVPVLFAIIARFAGSPIAFEMTALTTFGAASLVLSTRNGRLRAMSIVASGFLTLFAVAISDNFHSVWIAIAWMTVCVWHLVANHWERIELCAAHQVRRGVGVRPLSVFVAIAICIASGLVVRDLFGESHRLTGGFMPTSGGWKWSNPAARSGVGSGDAAIAAQDHAESFGAVESDLFLESTESTLFDMFSDSIGEPKKKNKWERRQGMTADKVLEAHTKTAKSEKGGSSFSTDRMPAQKHLHLDDAAERAVIQWAGPTGIRLAMNRYDTFDGVDWTNEAQHRNEKLTRREIAGAAWFCDRMTKAFDKFTTDVNLLKVLRLNSTRLPVPMMTSALHIKDVDRQDFFAIDADGSFFMPGREKVPHLTVVNVAATRVMEDELWERIPDGKGSITNGANDRLNAHVAEWTAQSNHPYEKLQSIVSHLRDEFTFDRSAAAELPLDSDARGSAEEIAEGSLARSTTAVEDFLRTRRGGDHLFATTAALMAREIGLRSRLVTGFYVRPSAVDIAAGHTNVLPEDVHIWVEIQLDDGRWFEIEPTPGYREPIYTPSTWLVAKQFAAAKWPHAVGLFAAAGLVFATRLFWIEIGLSILYFAGAIVWPRGRMSLAMRVLQARAKYAGCPRVAGRPQRDWLLAITSAHDQLQHSARRFCDAADRAAFALDQERFHEHAVSKELMMKLKIRVLRQLTMKVTA
ncbi:Transglutaminase-like superfamily protein [Rubripirellula amarantea]|uniref:Transglutaminase-like superfamily protein n=1 Tax=Rubripirellula amarantea TaxID=2527999 RepID=A0A5C5WMA0_9BACT|nr:transglutaminase-like domain-containing protein [Rubripirellula amarantea]TWT50922.1 Transglutaminase-like superfamily protein [Rubripirellula amarantea]